MNIESSIKPIPADAAITLWNRLTHIHPGELTHAHNPDLFAFYRQYLKCCTWYIILYQHEQPIGLLPLTKTRNRFFSQPHQSYGGIHWLISAPADDQDTLKRILSWQVQTKPASGFWSVKIEQLPVQLDQQLHIELRSLHPVLNYTDRQKSTYWLKLFPGEKDQMEALKPNLRRKIRAAKRKGVTFRVGKEELLPDFMDVYGRNMHRLGSPAHGKDFFKSLLTSAQNERAVLAVAYYQGKAIGGGCWLSYNGFYENTHFATLGNYNHLYTSFGLHWEMICYAQGRGGHTYSFGRSTTGSTVEKFKTQWPVDVYPLYFNSTRPIKHTLTSKTWLSKIWKHLPSFLVNAIGPSIAKRIY
ncbi:MAG: hypothetical protein CO098_15105 [Bacteroidetes bacterium CG_4_9_14_3_um_filter_41_19]|nr:MAG: hypothetical protein CO098_15105 [Bacteroidetes bacterium CG_4_9_14_3_um_filter_41_19]